jgi:carbon storage regulator
MEEPFMLVLTRKAGEKIRIGDEIVLTVIEIKGNRIKLGIDAPSEVSIVRGELCDWSAESSEGRTLVADHPIVRVPVACR